jgi:adenosine deaminase
MNLARLPKVELHRHLEGSVRPATVSELTGVAARQCRMARGERGWKAFHAKFHPLRVLRLDRDGVERIAREAVEDAAADRIRYLELRFSPVFFSRRSDAPAARCAEWVIAAARREAKRHGMEIHFIAGIGRDKSREINRPILEALDVDGFVGLDLAGDERVASASVFGDFLRRGRRAGLRLTLHAGELCGPESVREAIAKFGAERIGHGLRVMGDARVVKLARDRGTVFEVCPTSNLKLITRRHPLRRMMRAGLAVTISTDDPAVFGTSLIRELQIARSLGADPWEVTRTACRAAFGGDPQRLERELAKEWGKEIGGGAEASTSTQRPRRTV